MGLDITAYKQLKVVENPQFDQYGGLVNWTKEWTPGVSMEWSEKHFPGRGEGVDSQKVYTWEDSLEFRAGSYSGYNWWRARLEKFAEGEDFQELINFADNEGVIGSVVSRKLANDFNKNAERASLYALTLGEEANYWFKLYKLWQEAFEMAADSGAVDFH